jgi:hypothetical protein
MLLLFDEEINIDLAIDEQRQSIIIALAQKYYQCPKVVLVEYEITE